MALINCPECGKEVSDKATVCIHCGYPMTDEKDSENFNNIEYLELLTKLEQAAHEYSIKCKNNSSNNYPNPSGVVRYVKAAMGCLNSDLKNHLDEYKQLVLILCDTIISNSYYIRGIDSNKIFTELNYKDMDYSIQQIMIDKISKLRKQEANELNPPLDNIFKMMKPFLPSDLQEMYQKAIDYCHSSEGQKAYDKILNNITNTEITNSKSEDIPKCPTCGSTNVRKISTGKKAFGFAMVGLFSSNLGKTMECKNCGCKW